MFMRISVTTASLVVGTLSASAVWPPADSSSMFRGNPAHTGVYASAAPALAAVQWTFLAGGRIVSTPAVVDGVVYVGGADHGVYAVRASDGTHVWRFAAKLAVNSSPAVNGDLVVFSSLDGNVYAVGVTDGRVRWTFKTSGERRFTAPGIHGLAPANEMMPDPFDVFLSSPTIVDGIVYIGSGDHGVYALNAQTGTLKWKFQTGDVVHATPAVVNGVVYVGSFDRNFYAIDAQTGQELWRFQTGDDPVIHNQIGIPGSAAVADGVVLFGCRDGHFYALDAGTGRLKWSEDNHMGWVIASPAVQNGIVYFPTSDGTQFKAINIATGALVWRTINKAISFSSPAIAGGRIYFGSHDGWVRALSLSTGAVEAEFQTEGNKANASKFVTADGKLDSGAMFLDRTLEATFAGLERNFSLGSVLSSPVIVGGVAYFGSTDGRLYAVR